MESKKKVTRKRGSMFDLIYLVPVIFVVILITFFVHKAWNEMSPQFEQEGLVDNPTAQEALAKGTDTLNGFNLLIPFVILFFFLILIIMAYYVEIHPVMIFVGILVFILALVLAVAFKDVFSEFSNDGEFANETATFAAPTFMMNNLPLIILVVGIIAMIALYAKWKGEGQ